MVLEMSMESIFVVVDMFFVGRLGPYAQATVALTESLITIVYAIAIGLSIGATAMVARRIGEKDPAGAARAAAQAIWLGLGTAAVLGALGAIFAPRLLAAMGAEAEVLEKGVGYTRVLLGGNASVLLLYLINAIFRGAGDAAIAMRSPGSQRLQHRLNRASSLDWGRSRLRVGVLPSRHDGPLARRDLRVHVCKPGSRCGSIARTRPVAH